MIKENLLEIQQKIVNACDRAGRDPKEVTLIAVSKTKPLSLITEAMEAGVGIFGENKPQELTEKYDILPKHLNWHMIGHLQTNKVKNVIGRACLIHSVDSLKLAEAIQKEAAKQNLIMSVLVEINIGREESKGGIYEEEAEDFIKNLSKLTHLRVEGLMTVAPIMDNPEDVRPYFKKLRNLYVDMKLKNIDNVTMCNLSMGMTDDFEIAIEEGATMVRVGTGIFGARSYMK